MVNKFFTTNLKTIYSLISLREFQLLHLFLNQVTSSSTILSAAWPSHNSGARPFFSSNTDWKASIISSRLFPTRIFVPCSTVTGRSVFGLKFRQGTSRIVLSSLMPLLSVKIIEALAIRFMKSRLPRGSSNRILLLSEKISLSSFDSSLPRVRG